jgi:trigger factor
VVVDPRRPAELSPARPARVTVDRVVELRNPDLDAAFAERMGHGSIAELRRGLRDRLATAKEERARARLERALVEQLVARNPFAVPSNLVSERARVLVASIAAQLGEQSGSASPPTLDDLADSRRADVLAEAEHSVRRELVLEAVAREQALAVTEADRAAWIEQIASELGQSPGEVGAHLKARGSLSTIDAAILEDKALRAMLARAGAGGGGAAGGEAR